MPRKQTHSEDPQRGAVALLNPGPALLYAAAAAAAKAGPRGRDSGEEVATAAAHLSGVGRPGAGSSGRARKRVRPSSSAQADQAVLARRGRPQSNSPDPPLTSARPSEVGQSGASSFTSATPTEGAARLRLERGETPRGIGACTRGCGLGKRSLLDRFGRGRRRREASRIERERPPRGGPLGEEAEEIECVVLGEAEGCRIGG